MPSSAQPSFMSALPTHPIFASADAQDKDWEIVNPVPVHRQTLAIRGFDLIVVVNNELRISSLAEIKDGRGAAGGRQYKTLATPDITFEITSIAVNPSGKLLAVVGTDQVAVVVLPAPGYGGMAGQKVSCRTIKVVSTEHPLGGDSSIAKVLWHPWGQSGCSLWLLSTDSVLREFCLLSNPTSPSQTFAFLPTQIAPKRKAGFSARDPRATFASSFAFGTGTEGWGPLMVYGLIGNGDLYVLGPVLPVKASVPIAYLDSLASVLEVKTKALQAAALHDQETLETVTQKARLGAQQKWIDSLLSQTTGDDSRTAELSVPASGRAALSQGPLLLNPAPRDLEDEDDDALASDIAIVGEDVGLVIVAWSSGRVDVGFELEQPEARWESTQDPITNPPSLAIYETVALPSSQVDSQQLASIVQDPNYDDTFYVQRASGVHALSVGRWIGDLKIALSGPDPSTALGTFWAAGKGSEVAAVISTGGSEDETMAGLTLFSDVYLSYGLLGLSSSSRLAALELELRFDATAEPTSNAAPSVGTPAKAISAEQGYISLLTENRFDYDKIIKTASIPLDARSVLGKTSSKPLETVDADTLRTLGGAIALVQERIHAVDAASAQIERRLDLQIQEVARQLERVSSLMESLKKTKGPGARVDQVLDRQLALVTRVDKALQRLMDDQQPVLSDVEKRWFKELERLRDNVRGAGGIARSKGLTGKTAQLSGQLNSLRPVLEAVRRRSEREATQGKQETLGKAQISRIEIALADEADRIAELTDKIQGLDLRLRSD